MKPPTNLIRLERGGGGERWRVTCIRCQRPHLVVHAKRERYLLEPWPCQQCRREDGRRRYKDEQTKYGVKATFGKPPQHVPPIQDQR